MKILPWLVFLGSAVLLWAMFSMAREHEPMTARQTLVDVRTRIGTGELTRQAAVRDLDRAIELASQKLKPALLADLYMLRGEVYFDMGGYEKAGHDFLRVLEAYRPGDRRAEAMLVDVEIASGQLQSAELRLRQILAQRPRDAQAWVRFGKMSQLSAQEAVDECYAQIDSALIPEDAATARKLLLSIAARDVRDPSRVSLILELRDFFSDDDVERVRIILDSADVASQSYRQARTATARSLEHEITEASATQLMELFTMADRHLEASQLGTMLLNSGALEASEEATLVMLRGFEALEQHENSRSIVRPWIPAGKALTIRNEEFFREACAALYKAKAWQDLVPLAGVMRMRGFPKETERLANLYQGIALLNRKEFDSEAIFALSRFLVGLDYEIFPKSRAIAYEAKAQAQRNLEDPGEIESLLGVYSFDPDCSGEVHLRLARLMLANPNRGAGPPLFHLTSAISKMPRRTAELMPEWIELGEKEIATSTVNMDSIYDRLKESKVWVQNSSQSAYRMWRFGERYLADQEWVGVNACAKRALTIYPGFLPALDQRIEAEWRLGNNQAASDLVLERIDLTGLDSDSKRWLERIPEAGTTNKHLIRLMRADPAHTGRLTVARTLVEDGELERALSFLSNAAPTDPGQTDASEQQLVAEILVALGHTDEAVELLTSLREADPESIDLAKLQLRSLLLGDDELKFDSALDSLLSQPAVALDELIGMADELIENERYDRALSMLEKLDHRIDLRGGEVLMRIALVHMLRGEYLVAEHFLERADAFESEGGPELARVFLQLDSRAWPQLAVEAKRLAESELIPSALGTAILAVFREDLETARELVDEALEADSNEFGWPLVSAACDYFQGVRAEDKDEEEEEESSEEELSDRHVRDIKRLLRGTRKNPRDPREALGLILALETPGWMPWARAKLAELQPETVGPLWPLFLEAHSLAWQEANDLAMSKLVAVHVVRPEFMPAWDLHEVLLKRKFDANEHPTIQRFRVARAEALRAVIPESEEIALAAASAAYSAEGPDRALELAGEMIERYPNWAPGLTYRAELLSSLNRHGQAFYAWADTCEHSKPDSDLRCVSKLFSSLRAAKRINTAPDDVEVFHILEGLARRLPLDPLITIHLAELDVETEAVDAATGIDRAFARLDRFRSNTQLSLDQLRTRSARNWIEFIAPIDTTHAEALLEKELLRRPGELELWLLRGEVFRTQGRLSDALANCELLLQMSRDTNVLKEKVMLMAESGERSLTLVPLLNEIEARPDTKPGDYDLALVRMRGQLNHEGPIPRNGLLALQNFWNGRRINPDLIKSSRLGLMYVQALLRSDEPDNRKRAREVIETLVRERELNRYEMPFFKAILGLTNERTVPEDALELDGSD